MSRVAVVTGGASGIGLACGKHLAAAGHRVALLDVQADLVASAADELGGTGHVVDVSDRAAVDAAFDTVRAELGPIEVLVTSAGVDSAAPFTEITADMWDRVIRVNLTGTFHCLQAALPDMLAAGWGRIVTISSSSAQQGAPGRVHYASSKGGVIALTKSLAMEVGRKGITVNTIPPSVIDTPMARAGEAEGSVPAIEVVANMTPVGRAGTPDDIGSMCAFLCSDDAGFITGQQIGVNGGWCV